MQVDVWVLILGMGLATYLPRMLPVILIDKIRLSGKIEKFLKRIPYTAMSALIFPGILSADTAAPIVGIIGGSAAFLFAWFKFPLMVCVLAAIGADLFLYLLI